MNNITSPTVSRRNAVAALAALPLAAALPRPSAQSPAEVSPVVPGSAVAAVIARRPDHFQRLPLSVQAMFGPLSQLEASLDFTQAEDVFDALSQLLDAAYDEMTHISGTFAGRPKGKQMA